MTNRQPCLHYLGLIGILALGAGLRFWHLDLKPLWLDEVITAIFSLGKQYDDLPLNALLPLANVEQIFTFKSGVSCQEIANNLISDSSHPPLFFCGMYSWLSQMIPLGAEWVVKLRSLPAWFGVASILSIYVLNRVAFSPASGMMAALIMATSPFAVYLSQEARHYTLPMLLITIALLALVQIQNQVCQQQRPTLRLWIFWTIINVVGIYVHYFVLLSFIAQICTVISIAFYLRQQVKYTYFRYSYLPLTFASGGVVISFLPWLPSLMSQFQNAETHWLPATQHIAPLYHTLLNWVLMVVIFPVENQALAITIISALGMIILAGGLGWGVYKQVDKHLRLQGKAGSHPATITLLLFTTFVLLQFWAIAYLFGKDITVITRYCFVYYPSFCALLAASISQAPRLKWTVIFTGMLSSVFVISNLAYQKAYQPTAVAAKMNIDTNVPIMLVVRYTNYQNVALGLSFALALEKARSETANTAVPDSLAFIGKKDENLSVFWDNLAQMSPPPTPQMNLWIVGPGMIREHYLPEVSFNGQTVCRIDEAQHYRLGVPYQLYRCFTHLSAKNL